MRPSSHLQQRRMEESNSVSTDGEEMSVGSWLPYQQQTSLPAPRATILPRRMDPDGHRFSTKSSHMETRQRTRSHSPPLMAIRPISSQRSSTEHNVSVLAQLIWARDWEAAEDVLLLLEEEDPSKTTEASKETLLPCFPMLGQSPSTSGLPLHLACTMRPLPPVSFMEKLIQAYPLACQVRQLTWGLLPLHLASDLSSILMLTMAGGGGYTIQRQNVSPRRLPHTYKQEQEHVGSFEATDPHGPDKSRFKRGSSTILSSVLAWKPNDDCSEEQNNHKRIVQLLLRVHPESIYERQESNGMLPLHIAASTARSENGVVSPISSSVLQLLLQSAPDTRNVEDGYGDTPVALAWRQVLYCCDQCGNNSHLPCLCENRIVGISSRFLHPLLREDIQMVSSLHKRSHAGSTNHQSSRPDSQHSTNTSMHKGFLKPAPPSSGRDTADESRDDDVSSPNKRSFFGTRMHTGFNTPAPPGSAPDTADESRDDDSEIDDDDNDLSKKNVNNWQSDRLAVPEVCSPTQKQLFHEIIPIERAEEMGSASDDIHILSDMKGDHQESRLLVVDQEEVLPLVLSARPPQASNTATKEESYSQTCNSSHQRGARPESSTDDPEMWRATVCRISPVPPRESYKTKRIFYSQVCASSNHRRNMEMYPRAATPPVTGKEATMRPLPARPRSSITATTNNIEISEQEDTVEHQQMVWLEETTTQKTKEEWPPQINEKFDLTIHNGDEGWSQDDDTIPSTGIKWHLLNCGRKKVGEYSVLGKTVPTSCSPTGIKNQHRRTWMSSSALCSLPFSVDRDVREEESSQRMTLDSIANDEMSSPRGRTMVVSMKNHHHPRNFPEQVRSTSRTNSTTSSSVVSSSPNHSASLASAIPVRSIRSIHVLRLQLRLTELRRPISNSKHPKRPPNPYYEIFVTNGESIASRYLSYPLMATRDGTWDEVLMDVTPRKIRGKSPTPPHKLSTGFNSNSSDNVESCSASSLSSSRGGGGMDENINLLIGIRVLHCKHKGLDNNSNNKPSIMIGVPNVIGECRASFEIFQEEPRQPLLKGFEVMGWLEVVRLSLSS